MSFRSQDFKMSHKRNVPPWKRGIGFQPLETSCEYVLQELFQTKDFLYSKMAHDWSGIVGAQIAAVTRPCRIQVFKNEGTLWIEVDGSGSLWIPAHGATLIERVNQYMGYKAVSRIIFRKTHLQIFLGIGSTQVSVSLATPPQSPKDLVCPTLYQHVPNLQCLASTSLGEALIELAYLMKFAT